MRSTSSQLWHKAHIVAAVGWSDFVLKYRGSMLGFLWSLLLPLTKFFVILHIFRQFITDIDHYPIYLFIGIIFWEHFSLTTTACMTMLHDKSGIIQRVRFSHILLILAVGWTHILILVAYLFIALMAMFLSGIFPEFSILYVLLSILQATLLALGIGMLLSANSLRFRDVPHAWSILLQVLFWLTPVMYTYRHMATLSQDAAQILLGSLDISPWSLLDYFIRFQPLSILIFDARRAILYADSIGVPSVVHSVVFTLVCACIFMGGMLVFIRRSRYFLQEY